MSALRLLRAVAILTGMSIAVMVLSARRVAAQSSPRGTADVRGTVLLPDRSTPAAGVVVLVLHATRDTTLARAVTNDRGTFAARIGVESSETRVRLRLLRLGHQPTTLGPFATTESLRLVLANAPIRLARFDVRASRECRVQPDSGRLVAQLFEEARKVLLASVSTNAGVPDSARYDLFSRVQDTRGRLVAPEERREVRGIATKPFVSVGADALARHGYVVESSDSSTFYAPDAEVLLSDRFAATHCLFVVMGEGARRGAIGVGFRPERRRNGVTDIRGTLWLDSTTIELQRVDFTYDPYPDEFTRVGVGGEVHFARTSAGSWLVSTWAIRMPRAVIQRIPRLTSAGFTSRTIVEGLIVTGGDVRSVRRQGAELFAAAGSAAPAMADSTLQRASAARAIPDLGATPGATRRDTSALRTNTDSALATTLCSTRETGLEGSVSGRVADDIGNGVSGVTVVAEWNEQFRRGAGDAWLWRTVRREGTSGVGGLFTLCGLPIGRAVSVFTTLNGRVSPTIGVRPQRIAQRMAAPVGLPANVSASQLARLRVRVLQPNDAGIADAEVVAKVGANEREGRTDSTGLVRFEGLTGGDIELRVRRVGFAATRVRSRIESGENELTVRLDGNVAMLEGMRIVGNRRVNGRLDDFEMRVRRREASAFVTREEIEKRNPVALTVMLRSLPGIHVVDSANVKVAVSTRGKKKEPGGLNMVPCVLRVALDGNILPPGFDLDAIPPVQVHGIEVFSGPASVPPQYQGLRTDSMCGLIVIWTRTGDSG